LNDHPQQPLLDPDTTLAKLLQNIEAVPDSEIISLDEARGRVCARTVLAPLDLPPFEASAMDGLAIKWADDVFSSESPWELPIQGVSLAGVPYNEHLKANHAVRIFTGAMLPAGADTIVIQENTQLQPDRVCIHKLPTQGANIRAPGHDICIGQTLLEKGKDITAFDIGWLAASGISKLASSRKLRISIFSTGDELVEAGSKLAAGQIYESNRVMLKQLFGGLPVDIRDLGILPDDLNRITTALAGSAEESDVIITSGGVSVGDADYVRNALQALGSLSFWKLAIKPGKPLAYGKIGHCHFFGLPGNPVSSIITFLLFVVPALRKLAGSSGHQPLELQGTLRGEIRHSKGRVEYQRGIYQLRGAIIEVRTTGDQGSNRIGSFSNSNCLIRIPPQRGNIGPGEEITLLPFTGLLP